MTPAARFAAAADILQDIQIGAAAEKALTSWARSSRYAGSGDRAAIRDIVYDTLRRKGSRAKLAGYQGAEDADLTGRALIIGGLVEAGVSLDTVFSGLGHSPEPVTEAELGRLAAAQPHSDSEDLPEWLYPQLQASLGDGMDAYVTAMRQRAPVWLRVNSIKCDAEQAIAALAEDDITVEADASCPTALRVTGGERKIARSSAYQDGLVELQDISPQRAVQRLGDLSGQTVLDFCAGGGGKALAMAGQFAMSITAYDINPRRMLDLPIRAKRAEARIQVVETLPKKTFDLVLLDVPCSGSGSWARDPDGRWRLDQDMLDELKAEQASILDQAKDFVSADGRLVYMTCSVLDAENQGALQAFCDRAGWKFVRQEKFGPPAAGDGFYMAELSRNDAPD